MESQIESTLSSLKGISETHYNALKQSTVNLVATKFTAVSEALNSFESDLLAEARDLKRDLLISVTADLMVQANIWSGFTRSQYLAALRKEANIVDPQRAAFLDRLLATIEA